jgi:hypothetical protein
MKTCTQCERALPLDRFAKTGAKYGSPLRSYCKDCGNEKTRQYAQANKERRNERLREWRARNPEAARQKDLRARLMSKYNLTPAEVEELREVQGGKCALCHLTTRLLVVDHDHATGKVRAMLCRNCNTIMGAVDADPTILDRMAEYIGHESSRFASSSKTSA